MQGEVQFTLEAKRVHQSVCVQGASVFRRGPQGTGNCVGGATRIDMTTHGNKTGQVPLASKQALPFLPNIYLSLSLSVSSPLILNACNELRCLSLIVFAETL